MRKFYFKFSFYYKKDQNEKIKIAIGGKYVIKKLKILVNSRKYYFLKYLLLNIC